MRKFWRIWLSFILGLVTIGPLVWRLTPDKQEQSQTAEGPRLGLFSKTKAVILAGPPDLDPSQVGCESTKPFGLVQGTVASTLGVALSWGNRDGRPRAQYWLYRAERAPKDSEHLGVPLGEVQVVMNQGCAFLDTFDLREGLVFYSVKDLVTGKIETVSVAVKRAVILGEQDESLLGKEIDLPAHPFGTDALGRDILARLIHGGRISLWTGLFGPLLWTMIGVVFGLIAGMQGGFIDEWIMRLCDFLTALPFFLIAILIKVAFGPIEDGNWGAQVMPMLVAMVVLNWAQAARLVRGQVLQLKALEFVQNARALGFSRTRILFSELLPNLRGVLTVYFTFAIPSAIFIEAFLSFLGLGVSPPAVSWGGLCRDGLKSLFSNPWEFFVPALVLSLTVLSFQLAGEEFRKRGERSR